MAENGGADRARDEADGVDGERLQRTDPGVGVREKQLCENQAGDGRVKEEIIPFDRRPHRGCDDSTAKLELMLRRAELGAIEVNCCHGPFLRHPLAGFRDERVASQRVPARSGTAAGTVGGLAGENAEALTHRGP